jgi:hypothetical protein
LKTSPQHCYFLFLRGMCAAKHFAAATLVDVRECEVWSVKCGACFSHWPLRTPHSFLLRVQFDDELLVDGQGNFVALGQRNYLAGQVGEVDLQP